MLVGVNDYRQHLTLAATDGDNGALLAQLRESQSAAESYCNRVFEVTLYEDFPEPADGLLYLKDWAGVTLSGTFGDDEVELGVWYLAGADFASDSFGDAQKLVQNTAWRLEESDGAIRWLGDYRHFARCGWCAGDLFTRYTAGVTACTAPQDLKLAIMQIAAGLRLQAAQQQASVVQQSGGTGFVKSIQRGQSRIQYATPSEAATGSTANQPAAPDPWEILDKYRKRVIA